MENEQSMTELVGDFKRARQDVWRVRFCSVGLFCIAFGLLSVFFWIAFGCVWLLLVA